jgi:stearoyl-CoA desaturase (Delta-9 desaturase)
MLIILSFLIAHWLLSLFFQTFFQYRYAWHRVFTTNKLWERVFYLLAYLFEGASFLNPRAYALMLRAHHAYSHREQDPQPPHFLADIFQLMKATLITFGDHVKRIKDPEAQLSGHYPEWQVVDRMGSSLLSRLLFSAAYIAFYIFFAPYWWLFLLLPIHFTMGPIHGAIVNWCGHKNGYTNFDNKDKSRITTPFDFLMPGELFQNNHHKHPNSANFAKRWLR